MRCKNKVANCIMIDVAIEHYYNDVLKRGNNIDVSLRLHAKQPDAVVYI